MAAAELPRAARLDHAHDEQQFNSIPLDLAGAAPPRSGDKTAQQGYKRPRARSLPAQSMPGRLPMEALHAVHALLPSHLPPATRTPPHAQGSWAACAAHGCSVIGDPMGWPTAVCWVFLTCPRRVLTSSELTDLSLRSCSCSTPQRCAAYASPRLAQAPVQPRRTPSLLVFPDACGEVWHPRTSHVVWRTCKRPPSGYR